MSDTCDISKKKTVVFISGAGSGLGRACALTAGKIFHNNSLFLLCGRNVNNLNETKQMVRNINSTINIEVFQLDLENIDEDQTRALLSKLLKLDQFSYECFLLIHNAGDVGDLTKVSYQFTKKAPIESLMNINFVGTVIVNNLLMDIIKSGCKPDDTLILIVNVSSMAAVCPVPLCSLYGSAKACRDMFFRCLSNEWSKSEKIKLFVVNYAPGAMDTAMLKLLSDGLVAKHEDDIDKYDIEVITPLMSSDKLFHKILLKYSSFESGSRHDYYDL